MCRSTNGEPAGITIGIRNTTLPQDPEQRSLHRVLLWLVYLNDVEQGGETEFYYQQARVKAQREPCSLPMHLHSYPSRMHSRIG